VLNLLHEEYKKTPKKYGTDVIKLANYISGMGGITKMVQNSMTASSFKELEKRVKQQGENSVAHTSFPTSLEVSVAKQNAVDEEIWAELSKAEMLAEMIEKYGHIAVFIPKQTLPTKFV
jgi:hypothetical protein